MPSIQKKIAFTKAYIRIFLVNRVKRLLGVERQQHFYVNPKYHVAYYLVTKVLSSSICQLMLEDSGIAFEPKLVHEKHREHFDYRLALGDGADFTFAFVRNPFERLVSAYKDKVVRTRTHQQASPYDHYLDGLLMTVSSFSEFAFWICQIDDELAELHFVSQHNILFSNQELHSPIDFIGKIESVESDWAYIQERTGLPDLGHFNRTPKDDWRDYYDLKTAELVYKRYKKDIESFGYEEAYQELINYLTEKRKRTDS